MSHVLQISDELYKMMTTLAAERNQSAEELIHDLLDSAWEEACARYDAAFEDSADWLDGAREALAQADVGQVTSYPSTESFLRHLGAREEYLDAARRVDRGEPADAEKQ